MNITYYYKGIKINYGLKCSKKYNPHCVVLKYLLFHVPTLWDYINVSIKFYLTVKPKYISMIDE